MAEIIEAIVEQPKSTETEIRNPFDEGKTLTWDDIVNRGQSNPVTNQQPASTEVAKETDTPFDVNSFLKTEFGWENLDAAKNEYTELKKLKEQPPAPTKPTYANEESERFANLLAEGKIDDANDIINQQKALKKLSELDVTSRSNAEQVLKAKLQNEYKELQPDEIDYLLQEKYSIPEKPEQGIDQTDAEYATAIASWEKKVQMAEKRMTIDAKLAKPELAKLQKEIVLPDIPKQNLQPQVDQKELDNIKAARENYLKTVNSDYSKVDGFNTIVKDKDAGDVSISYSLSAEEKAALKPLVENFNADEYFASRWFDKEGKPNVPQMMKDLFLLENPDKVFQKFGSEGMNKNKAQNLLQESNVDINGRNGGSAMQTEQQIQAAQAQKKMEDAIWNA